MPLVIKNNAVGLLQLAIGAGAVSTTLQGGHTMPTLGAGDYCFATFVSPSNTVEVVKVTAIVGNVITHGATSNAFDAGSLFELRPCKEAIDALMQEATAKAVVTMAGTDTYTGTASPVPVGYVGMAWVLKFTNANTATAPTVNLNGLGAKTLKTRDGAALVAGDIKAGSVHVVHYDGVDMIATTLAQDVPTGVIKDYLGATAPATYIFGDGRTIGSATSGGTNRAHADTAALYALLWGSIANTELPIQDSAGTPTTRGANAAADFAANKRLPVPDFRGRVTAGRDDMGGTAANRITNAVSGFVGTTLGAAGGSQSHTLVVAEVPPLNVVYTTATLASTGSNSLQGNNDGGIGGFFTNGGGGAHRNVQPTLLVNKIIKL